MLTLVSVSPPAPPPPAATLIRPPLTRSSSLCRSRRSLLSSPQSSLMSADPDLLSMASSSLSYRPEADDEHIMFSSDRRGYVAVAGTPRNGFTVWTYRCLDSNINTNALSVCLCVTCRCVFCLNLKYYNAIL